MDDNTNANMIYSNLQSKEQIVKSRSNTKRLTNIGISAWLSWSSTASSPLYISSSPPSSYTSSRSPAAMDMKTRSAHRLTSRRFLLFSCLRLCTASSDFIRESKVSSMIFPDSASRKRTSLWSMGGHQIQENIEGNQKGPA